jgi:FemAB-related protein (PEP-CTERM system-associated)
MAARLDALDETAARVLVEVAQPEDGAAWDAYVERQPGATFYHLFGWRAVAEEAYRLRAPFLIARDDAKGPVRGILPLVRIPRPFTQYLTTGLFGSYGALLADEERYARALVGEAMRRVDIGQARHLHLKLVGGAPDEPGLVRHDIWVTAELDLGPSETALWERLSRKQRWALRQGRAVGLEPAHGVQELDGFYDVLFANMHRKGAPIYGLKFFRTLVRALAPFVDVITLRHRGRVISGAMVACFKGTMYVPFASSFAECFGLRANYVLYWEIMRRARELGCHTLDFGSSLRDSTGLLFKLKWRPRVVPIATYLYAARHRRPKLDPRESGVAAFVVGAWGRLPRSVAGLLGPALCRWIA